MDYLDNLLLNTDSYKPSHWLQYPPNTEYVFSYIESRGGDYNETVFFGLQGFIKDYLLKPITQQDINYANSFYNDHVGPNIFNKEGWEYILKRYGGYLPLKIRAVPEGLVVPTLNVLVNVENTDPKCYWLTSYVETAILRAVWYGTTVATQSWHIKQDIKKMMEKTCDNLDGLPFKLHDFGARGVSSYESAAIGGAAHLINFLGSDTMAGAIYANTHYQGFGKMFAYSVPAAEHSSITSWGRERELDAYNNMLNQFAKPGAIVAVVSDSYDIYYATSHLWGEKLRNKVIESGATVVIRPDSGEDIPSIVNFLLHKLNSKFGHTVNTKGYKVLNYVRLIQGDGINRHSINDIMNKVVENGWSMDNLNFGMGGMLLQGLNRDTLKFAYKASAAKVDGKWIDVYKDPVTDKGKRSKKGRVELYRCKSTGQYITRNSPPTITFEPVMETVFENGELKRDMMFDKVRENSEK